MGYRSDTIAISHDVGPLRPSESWKIREKPSENEESPEKRGAAGQMGSDTNGVGHKWVGQI